MSADVARGVQQFFRSLTPSPLDAPLRVTLQTAAERPCARAVQAREESQSGKLKVFDRIPLEKPVIVEVVKAANGKDSMQLAEGLQGRQMRLVIHGFRALECASTHLSCCLCKAFHPIKSLLLAAP